IDTGDEGDDSESCDSESSETLDLSKITEMRLVPADPAQQEEEQHNWIFSADQLGAAIDGDDPEWDDSQIPFTISYSNWIQLAVCLRKQWREDLNSSRRGQTTVPPVHRFSIPPPARSLCTSNQTSRSFSVIDRLNPPGTLYISTKQVVWLSDTKRDTWLISCHCLFMRCPEAFESPCL
ncbi:hypothetical protein R6Q59_000490, partial [Mikania micrantha]